MDYSIVLSEYIQAEPESKLSCPGRLSPSWHEYCNIGFYSSPPCPRFRSRAVKAPSRCPDIAPPVCYIPIPPSISQSRLSDPPIRLGSVGTLPSIVNH